jgi:hypothetical protein
MSWTTRGRAFAALSALALCPVLARGAATGPQPAFPRLQAASFTCSVDRKGTRIRLLADGTQKEAVDTDKLRVLYRAPDCYRIEVFSPLEPRRDEDGREAPARILCVEGQKMVALACGPLEAFVFDLARIRETMGEERAGEFYRTFVADGTPLFWLQSMRPETIRVVETRTADDDPGGDPVEYVIEGEPVAAVAANAHSGDRDKLGLEPLLRVTVDGDGFPRHVLARLYSPEWAILELSVTEHDLDPDLADSVFRLDLPDNSRVTEVPGS